MVKLPPSMLSLSKRKSLSSKAIVYSVCCISTVKGCIFANYQNKKTKSLNLKKKKKKTIECYQLLPFLLLGIPLNSVLINSKWSFLYLSSFFPSCYIIIIIVNTFLFLFISIIF